MVKLSFYKKHINVIIFIQANIRRFLVIKRFQNPKDKYTREILNHHLNCVINYRTEINHINTELTKKIRNINFPSEVSENICKYAIYKKYRILPNWQCTGDLQIIYNNEVYKKIEIKGFSSIGPISFGATETWDWIYIVDCTDYENKNFIVYELKLSNNHEIWQNIKLNKTQTYRDQCVIKKQRPRLDFKSLYNQLKEHFTIIFKDNVLNLNIDKDIVSNMSKLKITVKSQQYDKPNDTEKHKNETIKHKDEIKVIKKKEKKHCGEEQKSETVEYKNEIKVIKKKEKKEKKQHDETVEQKNEIKIIPHVLKTKNIEEHKNELLNGKLKLVDLCCGVGGFSLGLSKYATSVYGADICKYAKKVYDLNHENKMNIIDLNVVDIESIPDCDIITCGFPCQSFSISGKRQGFEDQRGNVFFSIMKIVNVKKPKYIIFENVKNLLTHDNGNSLKRILETIDESGYLCKYKLFDTAIHTKLPQHRERIYFICFRKDLKNEYKKIDMNSIVPTNNLFSIEEMLEEDVPDKYYYSLNDTNNMKIKDTIYQTIVNGVTKPFVVYQYRRGILRENKNDVCPTLVAIMGAGGHNIPIILDNHGIRKLTPTECFKLQGYYGDLPNIANCHLYKLAGNMITITIAKKLGRLLFGDVLR